jgi:hypothetical protein
LFFSSEGMGDQIVDYFKRKRFTLKLERFLCP